MRIGIIGRGTLGSSIAAGLAEHDAVDGIVATTRATADRNPSLVDSSDTIVICVKPTQVADVLEQIAPSLRRDHLVISTVAGVSIRGLRERSGDRAPIVRAMPNTPIRVSQAMTILARDADVDDATLARAREIFACVGKTVVLEERLMDAVTAVSGCGPAYAMLAIEALIDGAVAVGIPFETARTLVAQTFAGSAALLLASDRHPASLRADVATPGGRTIAAIATLERAGVRAAFIDATLAAASIV